MVFGLSMRVPHPPSRMMSCCIAASSRGGVAPGVLSGRYCCAAAKTVEHYSLRERSERVRIGQILIDEGVLSTATVMGPV